MILPIFSFFIFILIVLFVFDLTDKIYKYLILGIFAALFYISYIQSPYYLTVLISASITLTYLIFAVTIYIVRLPIVNYLIISFISLGFLLYMTGHPNLAQVVIDYTFYSIIILVIRLVSAGIKK